MQASRIPRQGSINMSVAVWVGLIARAGIDAETEVVMTALPGPRLGKIQGPGAHEQDRRSVRRRHRRCGPANSAEDNDGMRHHLRLTADHVVAGVPSWGRCDEADCYSDDRRGYYFSNSQSLNLSGHLRDLEKALAASGAA